MQLNASRTRCLNAVRFRIGRNRVAVSAAAYLVATYAIARLFGVSPVLLAIVGAGLAGLFWVLERVLVERPLAEMADAVEILAARDIVGLSDTLANLAQGESAPALRVNAPHVSRPNLPALRRLADALNTTVSRLEASAQALNDSSSEASRRVFYVGPDDYLQGATAAEFLGSRLRNGGDVLVISGRFNHAGMELRRRGFEAVLRERFPGLRVSGAFENRYDPAATYELVRMFLRSRPNLAAIYSLEAVGVQGAVRALAEAGLSDVVVVCHDLIGDTAADLMTGQIGATLFQDPIGQGWDTAVHLFNHLAHGWNPSEPRLMAEPVLVTRENLDQFWVPFLGPTDTPALAARRAKPLGPAARRLRIAILGVDDNLYWRQVRDGVLAAAEELGRLNATVEWVVPDPDFDVAIRGRTIERLVDEGYDGIATPVFDPALTRFINYASARGTAVATFNCETVSLHELVTLLSRQQRRLENVATSLEAVAYRDALTGVGNRHLMDDDLNRLRQHVNDMGGAAALLMIDIDRFKRYNDGFGHPAGDEVLRRVAHTIHREIRPQDGLYRCGGEEFLVVLRGAGMHEGRSAAERIVAAVSALGIPHQANRPSGTVTVSCGVATLVPGGRPVADALADADQALYAAKRGGRNRVCVYLETVGMRTIEDALAGTRTPPPVGEQQPDEPRDARPEDRDPLPAHPPAHHGTPLETKRSAWPSAGHASDAAAAASARYPGLH